MNYVRILCSRSVSLEWTTAGHRASSIACPSSRLGSLQTIVRCQLNRGVAVTNTRATHSDHGSSIPSPKKKRYASTTLTKPPFRDVIKRDPTSNNVARIDSKQQDVVLHKPAPTSVKKKNLVRTGIAITVPELKDVTAKKPESMDVVTTGPEFHDIVVNKPTMRDVVPSQPVGKELVRSQPELHEVVIARPSLKDVAASSNTGSSNDRMEDELSLVESTPHMNQLDFANPSSLAPAASELLDDISEQPLQLDNVKPLAPSQSFNSSYIKDSVALTNLVKLGMDLSQAEKVRRVADALVKMDFEKDIAPILLLLQEHGVKDENFGYVLSKWPGIVLENVNDISARIKNLKSNKFSQRRIATVLNKGPQILSLQTRKLHRQILFLKRIFKLTDQDLLNLVKEKPDVLMWEQSLIMHNIVALTKVMRFDDNILKGIFSESPEVYVTKRSALLEHYGYLHLEMHIPRKRIAEYPGILRHRLQIIKERHQFLVHLGKAQFNPQRPHYISLQALAECNNENFCEIVAQVPLEQFNDFLKTL